MDKLVGKVDHWLLYFLTKFHSFSTQDSEETITGVTSNLQLCLFIDFIVNGFTKNTKI